MLTLTGGLGTVQMRVGVGNAADPPTINTAAFDLPTGWSRIGVKNDRSLPNNATLYINGVQVAELNAGVGPFTSDSSFTSGVRLSRLARGGTGDNFVGTMRFDNIVSANQNIIFLPGDANFDGFVDIFDINLVSAHWSETWDPLLTPPPGPGPFLADANGDANEDGVVNIFDINLISANWSPAPGGSNAVPEPASWLLLCLGLAGLLAVGRKRIGR